MPRITNSITRRRSGSLNRKLSAGPERQLERSRMFHFGPQATMPFSAAYGAGYSPRESFGSVSPRGMLTSPRSGLSARPQSSHRMNPGDLKEMFLMNNTKGTVDAHAFWDRHVALTNMRQSFAASRGFSRESSPRPATAQAGHLSPRNRVRTTGRALGDTFGAGPAEWAGAIEEGLGRSFVHSEQAPSMTGTPTRKPVGSSAPKKFTLPAGVSLEELQSSHDQIKEKLLVRASSAPATTILKRACCMLYATMLLLPVCHLHARYARTRPRARSDSSFPFHRVPSEQIWIFYARLPLNR